MKQDWEGGVESDLEPTYIEDDINRNWYSPATKSVFPRMGRSLLFVHGQQSKFVMWLYVGLSEGAWEERGCSGVQVQRSIFKDYQFVDWSGGGRSNDVSAESSMSQTFFFLSCLLVLLTVMNEIQLDGDWEGDISAIENTHSDSICLPYSSQP